MFVSIKVGIYNRICLYRGNQIKLNLKHQTRIIFLADKHGNGGNVMRNVKHDYLKGLTESG